MSDTKKSETVVVSKLSDLIFVGLQRLHSEQKYPVRSADESDRFMTEMKQHVKSLRKIREDFENLMTGAILD